MGNTDTARKGMSVQDRKYKAQMQKVFLSLYKKPKTMLMVSLETGVLRANICRYVAEWERKDCIRIYRKGYCPITKHRAGFYTTNPELFSTIKSKSTQKK